MIGDHSDVVSRLKATLPARWFQDETPILDALLTGFAEAWGQIYRLIDYTRRQTRLSTSTDAWLDLVALDFLGPSYKRRPAEPDESFRVRIARELRRERGTRRSVMEAITDLVGTAPAIFEPWNTGDTGGYSSLDVGRSQPGSGMGYGVVGGWGNLSSPCQSFVTIRRPIGVGISAVAGWGCPIGGYGVGASAFIGIDMIHRQLTDDDLYKSLHDVLPVASVAWTKIVG